MSQSPKTDQIIELLVNQTDHTKEEIMQMIEKTIEDMDNMVNEEGAAYVVANNLGVMINLNQTTETLSIEQLIPGQSNVTILGRVSKIYSPRTFKRNDDTTGKVRNIEIIDNTGSARVALWDSRAEIIDQKEIKLGDIVRITGASTKTGFNDQIELSVGTQGLVDQVKGAEESEFPEVERAEIMTIGQMQQISDGEDVSVKGKIVDRQGIVSFDRDDGSTGKVTSLTLKDETGTIRVTFWDNNIEKAESFDVGDVVKIQDLRIGDGNYGKELTFNAYSTIERISDDQLEQLETTDLTEVDSISDIEEGMQKISVVGQIISLGEIRTYEREGETRQVANMTISDGTRAIRATLWGQQAPLVDQFAIGNVVRISNASARYNDFTGEVELSINQSSTLIDITDEVDPDSFKHDNTFVELAEVNQTVRGVSIKVQLNRKFEPREVTLKDGNTSNVMNAEVYDPKGQRARIAAWDENIAKIDEIPEGQAIIMHNVRIKPSDGEFPPEILVNQYTTIEETELEEIIPIIQSAASVQKNPMMHQKQTLDKLTQDTFIETSGTIVKAYKPAFYYSCNQCARKAVTEEGITDVGVCPVHGEVETRPRMILSMVLDDTHGTATIKLFDEIAEKFLGMSAMEALELIERLSDDNAPIKQQNIEMKDVQIKGKVIEDDYSQQLQINVEEIEFFDYSEETQAILDKFDT